MLCCLNPNCQNPLNSDELDLCQSCGTKLVLLRNRYRPILHLGGGGAGRTYLAEDINQENQRCLIKQFAPQVQGQAALHKSTELFTQEARRLQQLGQHPQIPSLIDCFQENSYLYLVRQFIEGQSLLRELEEQGIFDETKIRELLFNLLNVLKFVHQQGVSHGDIKPENIIRSLSPSSPDNWNQLVLTDFSLDKQLKTTSQVGITVGSLGYVPLEQMQSASVSPSGDLFSLGATCFHLLSGIHPWELSKIKGYGWFADWRQHLNQTLGANHSISVELAQILDKLLQENPQQRYQSAEAVLEDLNSQISTVPPVVVKDTPLPPPIESTALTPETESTVAPPDLSSSLAQGDSKETLPLAVLLRKNTKLRNRLLVIAGTIILLGLGGYGYWQVRASVKGDRTTEQTTATMADAVTDNQISLVNTLKYSDYVYALAISPDGETLVSGSGDKAIKIWNLSTEEHQNTITGHKGEVYSVVISPDGELIISGGYDNTVRIWELKTGMLKDTLIEHKSDVFSVAISPDGETIVSGSNDNTIKVWELKTGTVKHTLKGHDSFVYSVAISPDGETIVSGSNDNTIKVWDLNTGELKNTLTGHTDWVKTVAISPDGKTIVSGSTDDTIKIWDLKTGELKNTIDEVNNWVRAVAVSPDSKTIVSGGDDNTVQVWNLKTGELQNTLTGHEGYVLAVAISPDGKTIVSGSRDKTVKKWLRKD
ncbi:MAG: protein kinase [Symploca sp. SIO3C6]|uniref:Protein kinase n=1 Tax=Symploca sp. SIO1C4 TaxID=2607765 RepID=A0A6B3N8S9_9CYAN|nr:protein kinase [Symploca sp. SIO3C6]NER27022.1 protein kinase [Symploca sp. SIO1C4]